MHVVGVKMADSAPQELRKKAKRSAPVCLVSAKDHAKQFKEDLFVDSGCYAADFVSTARIFQEVTHWKII